MPVLKMSEMEIERTIKKKSNGQTRKELFIFNQYEHFEHSAYNKDSVSLKNRRVH